MVIILPLNFDIFEVTLGGDFLVHSRNVPWAPPSYFQLSQFKFNFFISLLKFQWQPVFSHFELNRKGVKNFKPRKKSSLTKVRSRLTLPWQYYSNWHIVVIEQLYQGGHKYHQSNKHHIFVPHCSLVTVCDLGRIIQPLYV